MRHLFTDARFPGFGLDPLRPGDESPPYEGVSAERRAELRKAVRAQCPRVPGVYGMVDARQRLIYVGKAKVLRTRLLSYFLKGNRHEKAGRILDHTARVVWEPVPCEFAALVRELELIRRWLPRYNVQGIPGRERQVYICLGRRPAPYLYMTREPTGKEMACFGPVKGAGMVREAARRLNDLFRLRDCSTQQTMHFADQRELFPILHTAGCLRYELNTCLGPCAAFTSRGTYGRHARGVRDLLDGRDSTMLRKLEAEMERASEQLNFERAAYLRDKIAPILWLRERLGWVDDARKRHSWVYPQRHHDGSTVWYLIRRARVCAAIPAPTDGISANIAIDAIRRVFVEESSWDRSIPKHLVDHVLLVAAWFRRRPEELKSALGPGEALDRCELHSQAA